MSVLAPLYVLATLAVAGPVLLHLMRQRPRRVLVFSSLQFLHATPVRPRRRRRVDDCLLLAMRITAIVLLVAAFLRPVWRAHGLPATAAAPRHTILLDRSASMRRGIAWPAAVAAVASELNASPPETATEVLAFDADVDSLLTFAESAAMSPRRRAAVATERVRQAGPSWGPTRLDRALKHVAVRVAEAARSAPPTGPWTVTVITDGRRDAVLSELEHVAWPTHVRVRLRVVGALGPMSGAPGHRPPLSSFQPAAETASRKPAAVVEPDRTADPGKATPGAWRRVPASAASEPGRPAPEPVPGDDTNVPPAATTARPRRAPAPADVARPTDARGADCNAVIQPVFDEHTQRLRELVLRVTTDPQTLATARHVPSSVGVAQETAGHRRRTLRIVARARPAGSGEKGGTPAFELDVSLPAAERATVLPPLPEELRHQPALVVELSGDDVSFDNRCFVAQPHAEPLRVAFVDGRPAEIASDRESARYFLQRASEASEGRLVLLEDWTPHSRGTSPRPEPDLVIVHGTSPAAQPDAWRRLLERGATLLYVFRSPEDAEALQSLLGATALRSETIGDLDFASWAVRVPHPLWTPSGLERPLDFSQVRFWRYVRFAAPPGSRTLARFDTGDPAVVEVDCGNGRLLLLASGWSLRDSQLALSTQFVPWLIGCAEYAAGRVPGRAMFEVGDPLERTIGRRAYATPTDPKGRRSSVPSVVLRGPDGTVARHTAPATRARVQFAAPRTPGHYSIEYPGGQREIVAVNVPMAESIAAPANFDRPQTTHTAAARPGASSPPGQPPASNHDTLAARLAALGIAATVVDRPTGTLTESAAAGQDGESPARDGTPAESTALAEWRRAALVQTESRQRLWWWCVVLAVLTLILETLCAARRGRAAQPTGSPIPLADAPRADTPPPARLSA